VKTKRVVTNGFTDKFDYSAESSLGVVRVWPSMLNQPTPCDMRPERPVENAEICS
jgi:hypothetical protein